MTIAIRIGEEDLDIQDFLITISLGLKKMEFVVWLILFP